MGEAFDGPKLVWDRNSKFTFEPFEEIVPSTKPWRIKNAWPMRGVVWIAGASGAAKTFFALDATQKLAGGAPTVWGRRAQECGVIYVAAEDPDGCRARVRAWRMARAKDRERPLPFVLVPQAVNLLDPGDVEDFGAAVRMQADAMAETGTPLGIVCLDTFSCCIPGTDENSSADMSKALEALYALARDLDCLVVVVAHFGKSGTSGGIRGWSGLSYNADGVIVLERDEEDPELRKVTFQKVKNGISGSAMHFRLDEVELGMFDDAGDPMTSCVVKFQPTSPEATTKRRAGPEDKPGPKLIVRALHQLIDTGQSYVVPPVPGVPPSMSGVMRLTLRDRAFHIGFMSEDDKFSTAKRNFNRDLMTLISAKVLREEDGIVWKVR